MTTEAEPRKRQGTGSTPVKMYSTTYFRALVKILQVLPEFDRVMVNLLINASVPPTAEKNLCEYGAVSRVFSQLENEGYIEPTGRKNSYSDGELKRNPDLKGFVLNYGSGNLRGGAAYRKTAKWSEFVTRWRGYIVGAEKEALLGKRKNGHNQ